MTSYCSGRKSATVTWNFPGSQVTPRFYSKRVPVDVSVYGVATDAQMVITPQSSALGDVSGFSPGASGVISGLNPSLVYWFWKYTLLFNATSATLNGMDLGGVQVGQGQNDSRFFETGPFRVKNGDVLAVAISGTNRQGRVTISGRSGTPEQYEIAITDAIGRRVTDRGSQPPTYSVDCGGCPPGQVDCGGCCSDCRQNLQKLRAISDKL